ncbi:MAG: hypothetical protein AAF333_05730 [Planctomycetota bacterium]
MGYLDLAGYRDELLASGASEAVLSEFDGVLQRRGDFDGNQILDSADIDELLTRFGDDDWFSDLDGSGIVDLADVEALVATIFLTRMGDADLDGSVSQSDLDAVLLNWGSTGLGWAAGSLDGDGTVGQADLNAVLLNWGAGEPPVVDFANIPEPATAVLLVVGIFARARRHRDGA